MYWITAIPFFLVLFYLGWQQWKFIFFLLLLSLPWSVEYSFNSSLGTDLPDEPLMGLTAVLFMGRFFLNPCDTVAWKHPLVFLLLLYLGWIIFTVPLSSDWLLSLKFLFAKSWYFIAFVFVPLQIFKTGRSMRLAGLIFLFSMLGVVVAIISRHAFYTFTFAGINKAVSPFFRNHVNYSAMLVCTFPLLIVVYQLNKRFRVLVITAIAMVLAALFFSYSRGAWLALLVGIVSYWLINKQRLLFAFTASLILIVVLVFWLSKNDRYLDYANHYKTTIFHTNFSEHLLATYRLKDLSTAERFNRWVAGTRMIKNNWLTGYGPNTFYNNYKPYQVPVFKTWVSDNKEHSTVHNYFLLILIEQGIPGLLFFILLAAAMLYYSETLYKRVQDRFYKSIIMACGVIVMMILTVNFLSDLIETDKVGSLFFLCLATLVAVDRHTKDQQPLIDTRSCL